MEVHFCKASQWSVRRIEEELIAADVEYKIQFDNVLHCGTVIVDEDDAEFAAAVAFAYSQLKEIV